MTLTGAMCGERAEWSCCRWRVRWSGPRRRYDLARRADRALVYEQVLTEGTDDDVRWFVDVDQLVELWSDVVLPGHVGRAWAGWLKERRGVTLPC